MRKSTIDIMQLVNVMVDPTEGGASGEVDGIFDDEPMCMFTTTLHSLQASKKGSHSPEWIEGSPRNGGISLKQVAVTPRSAIRRTSTADCTGSQSGTIISGARRPSVPAHHSSTCQSL